MRNWYTIGIVFLGGLAVGLLAFLFIQPAQTGNTGKDTTTNSTVTESNTQMQETSESPSNTESSQSSEAEAASSGTNQSTEASQNEEWEPNTATTTTPKLLFYYKPGWPLCQNTKDIVDDLKPLYVGDVEISYIPMRSEEGIRGRQTYNIRYGMVLLDRNGEVFWKEEGLQFGRSQIKSQLDSVVDEDDS